MDEESKYLGIRPLSYRKACEQAAIIASQGIACELVNFPGGYRVRVDGDLEAAKRLLEEVDGEKAKAAEENEAEPQYRVPVAALIGGGIVFLFFAWAQILSQNPLWFDNGVSDAEKIRAGEWWRVVTCLFLHADAGHLLSNMVFMAISAAGVIMMCGSGVGWLAILLSGVSGSFFNAVFRPEHLSLGSSTAVFGAWGILAGLRFFQKDGFARKAFWVALGGAVSMLAFFGMDAKTDVGAHVFGFASGILLGAFVSLLLAKRGKPGLAVQGICIAATFAVIVLSWGFALRLL